MGGLESQHCSGWGEAGPPHPWDLCSSTEEILLSEEYYKGLRGIEGKWGTLGEPLRPQKPPVLFPQTHSEASGIITQL